MITKLPSKPMVRETEALDATGQPIIITLAGTTLSLRVKGKPRTVYCVEYNRLLVECKNNRL